MRDRSEVEYRASYRRRVECVTCGCVFQVGETRPFAGVGRTEQAARSDAAVRAQAWAVKKKPKGPCPGCGRLPAGVVAKRRRFRHTVVVVPALLVFVAVFTFVAPPWANDLELFAGVVAGVAVVSGLIHAAVAWRNLHGNTVTNRNRAAAAVRRGDVTIVREGETEGAAPDAHAARPRAVAALVVCGVAAALAWAAPVVRVVSGWPPNDRLGPPVCGPGDEVRVYFDQRIYAVDELWNGNPTGTVEYAANGVTKRVPAAVRADRRSWDKTKIVARNSSWTIDLWAAVTIPADATPGTAVRVDLTMPLTYPRPMGENQFSEVEMTAEKVRDIRLADPGAAGRYTTLFWTGTIGGAVLVVLVGLFLSETYFPARKPVMRVTAETV